MTTGQCVSVIGAACGTLGSILTAFSLNSAISEINFARKPLEVTVEGIATKQPNIPVFTGLDRRFDKAGRKGAAIAWIGVGLLAMGFILQAVGVGLPL